MFRFIREFFLCSSFSIILIKIFTMIMIVLKIFCFLFHILLIFYPTINWTFSSCFGLEYDIALTPFIFEDKTTDYWCLFLLVAFIIPFSLFSILPVSRIMHFMKIISSLNKNKILIRKKKATKIWDVWKW